MAYCPNCGSSDYNEDTGCENCGYKPIIEGEVISETIEKTYEEKDGGQSSDGYYGYDKGFRAPEQKLSRVVKTVCVLATLFLPGVGCIFGIIAGFIFMNDPRLEYKSFGGTLLTLGILMTGVSVVCCVLNGMFDFVSYLFTW